MPSTRALRAERGDHQEKRELALVRWVGTLRTAERWSAPAGPIVRLCGAVAQLGERNTGSVEVEGSNPSSSTSFLNLELTTKGLLISGQRRR